MEVILSALHRRITARCGYWTLTGCEIELDGRRSAPFYYAWFALWCFCAWRDPHFVDRTVRRRRVVVTCNTKVRWGRGQIATVRATRTDSRQQVKQGSVKKRPSTRHRFTHQNSVQLCLAYCSYRQLAICASGHTAVRLPSQDARAGAGIRRTKISLADCNSDTTQKLPFAVNTI
jgi:hypothetical protein